MREPAFTYTVEVFSECEGDICKGPYLARVRNEDYPDGESPLEGRGETPIEAMADLNRALMAWRRGGAEAWFETARGKALVDHFVLAQPMPHRQAGVA